MASTHVPFFMDGRPTSRCVPGAADGQLLSWLGILSARDVLCPAATGRPAPVMVSHGEDAEFCKACRANGWSSFSMRGTEKFVGFGAHWVRREASRGSEGCLAALEPYKR
ncbi:unnamed protein product, partial [Prorocentrum cordatum]